MAYSIGSYRLGSTLGVGTFGKVKLAMHEGTTQKVAIKIINKAKMLSMEMLQKIQREINILQRLTHPHVIKLYELIDTPTDLFMVMEYVPGGELFDHIVQKSRLTEHEARRFFQQIVSGVEYFHQQLICHRDLKPENVLLDTNLNVKIGDFGLSNFIHDGDFLKTSCGSPNYASPEVVSGKSYAGPEVDVWSCGVILYALLCGSLPFDDEHVPNLFKRIKHGNFTLPGHLSELSRSLIVRLLVVDPAKRISFREVRRHPWFRRNLPSYLASPILHNVFLTQVDPSVINEMRKLGYDVVAENIELSLAVGCIPSRNTVAYHLLADKKARHSSTSIGGCWISSSVAHSVALLKDAEGPMRMNYNLKELPVAFPREILKRFASSTSCQFDALPYVVSSDNATMANFSVSTAHLSSCHCGSPMHIHCGAIDYSPGNPSWTSNRWRLAAESSLDSYSIMTAILTTLKSISYQWRFITPYRIRCTPLEVTISDLLPPNAYIEAAQNAQHGDESSAAASESSVTAVADTTADELSGSDTPLKFPVISNVGGRKDAVASRITSAALSQRPSVKLTIQLYKIATCRYLVDVQLFDGPVVESLSEALWITSAIQSTLTQMQHHKAPTDMGSGIPPTIVSPAPSITPSTGRTR